MSDTMRIAVCTRPGHIEVQTGPIPPLTDGSVLVGVTICGVCGSDVAAWLGTAGGSYPYSPGHEFCGVIRRTGARVTGVRVGQRVVINPNLGCGECVYCRADRPNLCDVLKTRPIKSNGGFADYVVLDHHMVHPLPDVLPDELATFIEPLSCALHAARRARVEARDAVVVFGAGMLGLLTALALKASGCTTTVVEPAEWRRKRVSDLLNVSAVSPDRLPDSTPAGTFDAAIECSGRSAAVAQAIRTLRKGGRLVLVGMVVDPGAAAVPLIDVTRRELDVAGAWLNPHTFGDAIRLAVEHRRMLEGLTVEAFRLNDIAAAFERARSPEVNRVLVRP